MFSNRAQHKSFQADYMFFTFDLETDLTDLFDWNTKQVYVYVTAHYKTSQFHSNQVVVWDRIIQDKKDAKLKLRNKKNSYPLRDYGNGLTKNEIKLVFSYQQFPVAGLMRDRHFDSPQQVATFQTYEYTA